MGHKNAGDRRSNGSEGTGEKGGKYREKIPEKGEGAGFLDRQKRDPQLDTRRLV